MANHFSADARHDITKALIKHLADTTVVYFKTHTYHWNVAGENFYGLHVMFEKFYRELWESMDEIAERVRVFGEKTPPNLSTLLGLSSIPEAETSPASQLMLQTLRDDYLELAKKAVAVGAIAEKHEDHVTMDQMTQQATFLEKSAWMLRSSLTN